MIRTQIRRYAVLPVALAASIGVAACGSSATATGHTASASTGYGAGAYGGSSSSVSSTATAASATTVRLGKTSKGKIIVNSRGFTAYLFTADRRNSDRCVKVSGCMSIWPALTVKGRPSAGSGLKRSLLGSIKLPNGRHQVTYAGHPLYTYTGDSGPGNTSYIGATSFGGTWLGINAAGKSVH